MIRTSDRILRKIKKMKDTFGEYAFYGNVDLKKVRALHELIVEYTDKFLEDHALQDLLLNRGREIKNRPKDWFDVSGVCWNRKKVLLHLCALETMIEMATIPPSKLVVVKFPQIIVPGQDLPEVETSDDEGVEAFQIEWMRSKDTPIIREYQKLLHSSLRQYNFQSILSQMSKCLVLPLGTDFKEEEKYQERIRKVFGHDEHNALDNAYYNAGNRRLRSTRDILTKLKASEFGQHFVVDREAIEEYSR